MAFPLKILFEEADAPKCGKGKYNLNVIEFVLDTYTITPLYIFYSHIYEHKFVETYLEGDTTN